MAVRYKDYYKILGVEKDATQEAIKKAFRKLAMKCHPDKVKESEKKVAEEKFKEINEAYEALGDPEKRKRYDSFGANYKDGMNFDPPPGFQGGNAGRSAGGNFGGGEAGNFSDFFEALFGSGLFGDAGAGGRRGRKSANFGGMGGGMPFGFGNMGGQQAAQPGSDVESELTISLRDAFQGVKKSFRLSGENYERDLEVRIPAGARTGQKLRLSGQGQHGGDLYLKLQVTETEDPFRLDGDRLERDLFITPWQAALGDTQEVETLDGSVDLDIPAGLSSGQKMRLKGKGWPKKDGERGDLYVRLMIRMPKSLSKAERELYEKLRELGGEK